MATAKKKAPIKKVAAKKTHALPLLGSRNKDEYYAENDFAWSDYGYSIRGCCGLGIIADFSVSERVACGKTSITEFDKDFLDDLISSLPNRSNIATTIIKCNDGRPLSHANAACNHVLRAMGFVKAHDFLGNSGNHLRLWIRVDASRKIRKPKAKK